MSIENKENEKNIIENNNNQENKDEKKILKKINKNKNISSDIKSKLIYLIKFQKERNEIVKNKYEIEENELEFKYENQFISIYNKIQNILENKEEITLTEDEIKTYNINENNNNKNIENNIENNNKNNENNNENNIENNSENNNENNNENNIENNNENNNEIKIETNNENNNENNNKNNNKNIEINIENNNENNNNNNYNYWYKIIINSNYFTINDLDNEILKSIKKVSIENLNINDFKITFEFNENNYFSPKILTKTFLYENNNLKKGIGTEILWKNEKKNPTKEIKIKKIKKGKKIVKKEVEEDCDSFFNIFKEDTQFEYLKDEVTFFKHEFFKFQLEYFLNIQFSKIEESEDDFSEEENEEKNKKNKNNNNNNKQKEECKNQ